ncbi:MAG: hypothetical protein JWR26_1646 [Pedosphaera sp.]|nr:hypothetical protein [Pedosphaera sp.]
MKKAILIVVFILAGFGGGVVFMKALGDKPPGARPAAAEEEKDPGPRLTHDADGNVIINMDDETQGNIGITVAKPAAAQYNRELTGYGRVMDPAPLAALVTEQASAQAAYVASSNELVRLKTLEGQGNASTRALQTAEAAALHDQLAIQSAKDRLAMGWGKSLAGQGDLGAFVQSLTAQDAALIRIDLPADEAMKLQPGGARVLPISGNAVEADFLGATAGVDPQMQGRGFIFLVKQNGTGLVSGEAVTGYLKVPGETLEGVVIPRAAVVRTEGTGWVYVLKGSAEAFRRTQIPLDHATDAGWFVSKGVTAEDYVVVTGAQTLLSEEMKASLKPD